MKTVVFKYFTAICLLLGILESNNIPVVSIFGNQICAAKQTDTGTEDPVKESETLRVETNKDYLHQIIDFSFFEPVFHLTIKHPVLYKTKFPYCFYPDVLTPPPNC